MPVPECESMVSNGAAACGGCTNAIDFPAFKPRDLNGRLSTQIVTDAVPGARVVKAFNTLPAASLGAEAFGTWRRVVSSSSRAMTRRPEESSSALIERLGFAAVDLGVIAEGGRAQQFGDGDGHQVFVLLGCSARR